MLKGKKEREKDTELTRNERSKKKIEDEKEKITLKFHFEKNVM